LSIQRPDIPHTACSTIGSVADRAKLAEELTCAVKELTARYYDERAEGGREHRLVVAVYPSP